jgi:hypothetical protein
MCSGRKFGKSANRSISVMKEAKKHCHSERSEESAVLDGSRGYEKQILRRFAPQNDIRRFSTNC